jgi:stalled ribosome rescue protein Dom34
MKPKTHKRGYPVAIMVGIENDHSILWQVYSQVAKYQQTISLNNRNDSKTVYNFHEAIITSLRPTLKEGLRSIIVISPPKTNFANDFLNHINNHHAWLVRGPSKAVFSTITGTANTPAQVASLAKSAVFKQLINKTTAEETENLIEIIEKRLNETGNLVRFSLEEAENIILAKQAPGKPKPDYLLITDNYLSSSNHKNRIQRLLQIAKNKKVKTRIINAESNAGKRLTQLGGLICLAEPEKDNSYD